MTITRYTIVVLSLLLLVSCGRRVPKEELTADNLENKLQTLQTDAEIVQLCKDYIEFADDIDLARHAQDEWVAFDRPGAIAFCDELAEDNPGSARFAYLAGRADDSPVAQIEWGRKAVEIDPQWTYGYRLITATYAQYLFDANKDDSVAVQLAAMLPEDEPLFAKSVELQPNESYPLEHMYRLQVYQGNYADAQETLDKAFDMKARWASGIEQAMLYARMDKFDDAFKALQEQLRAGLPEGEKNPHEEEYYRYILGSTDKYEELLKHIKSQKGYKDDSYDLYDIACCYAQLGQPDDAFTYLTRATDKGWEMVAQSKEDESLNSLHDDARWAGFIAAVQANWDKGKEDRKLAALATKIDKVAPEWALTGIDGDTVHLSDLRGDVVILDFWATWCGPCRRTMPVLNQFVRDNTSDKVKVFSISVWDNARRKQIRFMDDNDYAMTLLFGTDSLAEAYEFDGIPHMAVIDPEGHIRYEETGYSEELPEKLIWWTQDLL